jgi:hypothetical protein
MMYPTTVCLEQLDTIVNNISGFICLDRENISYKENFSVVRESYYIQTVNDIIQLSEVVFV